MPNLNNVQIIGRLGKDPEKRTSKSGTTYAIYPVAVDHLWKNRDGESKRETDWFNVEAWGKLGEICLSYLTKGRLVYIEGQLRTNRYEHEGETRYFTKVIARKMQMLDKQPRDTEEPEADQVIEDENVEEEEN
jgi:single-strand DNA-binding protein